MDYRLHAQLTDPARPSAELWRVFMGVALIVLVYIALGMLVMFTLARLFGETGFEELTAEMTGAQTPLGTIVQLMWIGMMTIPVMLVTVLLHNRSISSLFGPPSAALAGFLRVTLITFAAAFLIWILPPSEYRVTPVPALDRSVWVMLLPVSLMAILVQVLAEEIVFRGYLQQQLAARFDHWLVWMCVPAALFAALHYSEDFGPNTWLVVAWAFAFGCAAADLTARSGTLGAAIALHFVNNVITILIVAPNGRFDALALYHLPVDLADASLLRPMILIDLVVLICLWVAARIALRR
ncbi:CPBP family intramembrane glutamic endopeptidase [Pseudaestuariivita sp.]|uniref:CPBP family intramembrane glutamic endopeptidase n=1 Tax=Pseudaestuariivita sp. TaxID=2211669 RepID=UPI00405844DD